MASEDTAEPALDERGETDRDFHSATPPSHRSGPSPFNDGPEMLRDNHC